MYEEESQTWYILEKAELKLSPSFPIEGSDLSESPNVRMHYASYNR